MRIAVGMQYVLFMKGQRVNITYFQREEFLTILLNYSYFMLSLEDTTMLSRSTLATNDTTRVRDAGKGGGGGERGSEGPSDDNDWVTSCCGAADRQPALHMPQCPTLASADNDTLRTVSPEIQKVASPMICRSRNTMKRCPIRQTSMCPDVHNAG